MLALVECNPFNLPVVTAEGVSLGAAAAAVVPYYRPVGDEWVFRLGFFHPDQTPYYVSNVTLSADLFLTENGPFVLSMGLGSGITLYGDQSEAIIVVPRTSTILAVASADPSIPQFYWTRIVVRFVENGIRRSVAAIFICPFSPNLAQPWPVDNETQINVIVQTLPLLPISLTGSVNGSANLNGSVSLVAPIWLSGVIPSTPMLLGVLSQTDTLNGTITGAGSLSGSLTSQAPGTLALMGSVSGTALIAAAMTLTDMFAGALNGSGALVGSMTNVVSLVGAVPSTVRIQGAMIAQAPGSLALVGSIPGSGVVTGAMSTVSGGVMDFSNSNNSALLTAIAA